MGILMMSFFLTTDARPTVDHLIQHIRHIVNVGGAIPPMVATAGAFDATCGATIPLPT
jgi:microsomal dipeptidase-like Zn-dependent dipeptidase